MDITDVIKELATVDIFELKKDISLRIGNPFSLNYYSANLLIPDAYKQHVGGIPQGSLLLAFYENEEDVSEALLLRAIKPTTLPTDDDNTRSMIEYYKDDIKTSGAGSQLDPETRYQFGFSGLECRILGTFYKDDSGIVRFGADVENFYGAHNYSIYKPKGKILERIVNFRDGEMIPGSQNDVQIGKVRYSSSLRFAAHEDSIPVYITPKDFLGKRTALFGMTRIGKSNTVKKIIQATVVISQHAKNDLTKHKGSPDTLLDQFDTEGYPKYPVGQIVFDVNGEYANANLQDNGTAIYEMFDQKDYVNRYSLIEKDGFKVMKVNFYNDIATGFDLLCQHLSLETADYVSSFTSIDLSEPEDKSDIGNMVRYDRKIAAYLCVLYKAGFKLPENFKVRFTGQKEINELADKIDPKVGITIPQAVSWFTTVWDNYESHEFFQANKNWADDDLKAILVMLTRKSRSGSRGLVSGYIKLRDLSKYHTDTVGESFEIEMVNHLRSGAIVIVDLSQGDPTIQRTYSERICKKIFADSMARFVENRPNNYIQFYFEEAHNLFPKKDDKDLSQIYNRLAKEGAKLNLGLIYATQEVSSISANILKNTQNWFIAHLNNEDELKEIRKYYDFEDFADGLIRFSANIDKGFVRMKTYSNAFVISVQIDKFMVNK